MKIKLKEGSLPNIWKQCGTTYDNWQELHLGKEIEVKSIPDSIKHLVDISTNKKKESK